MAFMHQPAGYRCPFCRVAAGADLEADYTKQADVVVRDDAVTAFISSAWWPANAGHVLVVPNGHYENIYDIPDAVLAAVQVAGKRVALALKAAYGCDGTSFRQHNEPAGDQDVWHYHLHVFPRYAGDQLYVRTPERRTTTPAEREPYARTLRRHLAQQEAERAERIVNFNIMRFSGTLDDRVREPLVSDLIRIPGSGSNGAGAAQWAISASAAGALVVPWCSWRTGHHQKRRRTIMRRGSSAVTGGVPGAVA